MSFVKLGKTFFERSIVALRPETRFISSSVGLGATGSEHVAPIRSKCIKNIIDPNSSNLNINESLTITSSKAYDENDYNILTILDDLSQQVNSNNAAGIENEGFDAVLNEYLNSVNDAPNDVRFTKKIDMFRFDTPVKFNQNYNIKNNIRKNILPYHQHRYPNSGFHYTNYNTLNFYTGSNSPKHSALIYPNLNGNYTPSTGFTLDFWINPKYSNKTENEEFIAGSIFHMSSSICVSLVSGSGRDQNNLVNNFKIMVQLSQSADISPSSVNLATPASSYPNDLIFTSSNNLNKNHWHHVLLQWDPNNNAKNASLYVDNVATSFNIPSASLTTSNEIVVLGNYLNTDSINAAKLFNSSISAQDGLTQINPGTDDALNQDQIFINPLNAEIHNIRLFNKYLNDLEINEFKNKGINNKLVNSVNVYDSLLFYVPPFFYPKTRTREVIVTPFQTITDSTNDPFNVQFSFGVSGKMINLENFTREFIQGEFPRLLSLTGSTFTETIENITADAYVYNTGSITKRNTTVLPCDNGLFIPDYYPISISLMSESNSYFSYDKKTNHDYSKISLEELIPTSSLYPGLIFQEGPIFEQIAGTSPENPGVAPGSVLTIAQRTKDVSSNEIVLIDISNIYYGNRINPGSFEITDKNLTGSSGNISIKLKDNSEGSLYRADALTKHAEWNNVGDIFYDEGIVLIKSPHLFYFCKDSTDISFKGEQNIHTMILNVPFEKNEFNSSSNETYTKVTPSYNTFDKNEDSIYVTGLNIHDDNFNIIMKAHFAQPILKTEADEFVVRLKMDF
jgi:hypothetical protein